MVIDVTTWIEPSSASDYNVKGRWAWVDTTQWDSLLSDPGPNEVRLKSGGGTHMALLRDSTDKSWVLHWHTGATARLWRADSMATSTFSTHVPTDSAFNSFCAGHAVMADGRLMVVGGTLVGITGEQRVSIFNVNRIDATHRGWTFADTLDYGRWYATVTALGDGKVMAMSGTQFMKMQMFGGRETDGTESFMNDARVLDLGKRLPWESDQTPTTPRPAERHGHSANWYVSDGRTVVFGGLVEGGTVDTVTNPVWRLFLEDNDYGQKWTWNNPVTVGDADYSTEYLGRPRPRHRHAATIVDTSLFIFGGIGKDGSSNDVVLDDLWRLNLVTLQWKKFILSGAPGARYGHTMGADSLAKPDTSAHRPVLLVYGGRSSSSSYADGDVWVLTVNGSQGELPLSWRRVTPGGSTPGQREGHVAVMDRPLDHRMIVFGGDRSSGGLGNDVWELKPASDWTWTNISPGSGSTPSARTRHAAIYDGEWQRLLVFGGDTNTGSGGEVADLWSLPLDLGSPTWQQQWHGSAPAARQGHAAVFDARAYEAKVPERYSAGSNTWEQFTSAPRWQVDYPFMHQLRNGKLLYGGNGPAKRDTSWIFDPAAPAWTDSAVSGLLGGSSIMTGATADTVMKFGATDHPDVDALNGEGRYALVDSMSGATTWAEIDALPGGLKRRYHNLTIVPDGRALLTGGIRSDSKGADDKPVYSLTPYFYGSKKWGGALADDLARRSYHSTAMLLPDARILCASGIPIDDTLHATVYSPPYLYSNGTTLATRPFVTKMPSYTSFHYGEPLWVGVDAASISTISIVSLIRPGSVTHGFDQNQRYIRPLFTKDVTNKRMRVLIPPNPNHVPPGDYLLFAVRSDGVPWVAKWVRVEAETDATAPAAVEDLDVIVDYPSTVYLSWTAQGDDGTGPRTARRHEVRYSTSPITEGNWSSASLAHLGGPKPAGDAEFVGVVGLGACSYYAAMKTFDEQDNASALSNVVEFEMGGCGGGASSRRAHERTLRSETSTAMMQGEGHVGVVRFGRSVGTSVQIVNVGTSPLAIDSLGMVVATESGDSVAITVQGTLELATSEAVASIRSSIAGEVRAHIAAGYDAAPGETLTVDVGGQATALRVKALAVETASEASASGIVVETCSGDQWGQKRRIYPGSEAGTWIVEVAGDSARLVFHGGYTIEAFDELTPTAKVPAVRALARAEFEHSSIETLDLSSGSAADPIIVQPGEHVRVGFDDEAPQEGRSAFIALRTRSPSTAEQTRSTGTQTLPVQFALGQNKPNPFGDGTLIRFELPRRARVDLEVFDVHGRRIKRLARGEWAAGYHALEWNGRDAEGRRVGAGVYLYRMTAGSFTKSRKLVVLP